jgi:RNA polymerase sigma-70 factor (ECF subfamily)
LVETDLDVFLGRIAAGDLEAFGAWVARAERPVRQSLRPFAALVDAEAVVQETLLRVWQVAPRVEPDGRPNSLLRLALRTARNLALSIVRRRQGAWLGPDELERRLDQAVELEPAALPDPFLRRAIDECRQGLPPKPARALAARIESAGGESDQRLAHREGMRLNTFLQNFTRARRLLADCLRDKGIALEQYA